MSSTDLLKLAANLESKKSKINFEPDVLSTLGSLLLDVHAVCQPKPTDYENRRKLVQKFNKLALEVYGKNNGFPAVEAFGSFTMDLFTSNSDLDLSINFSNDMVDFPRDRKISCLKILADVLNDHQKRGLVTRVLPILTARVPVLKVVDCETGVECDFSIENKDGISRSLFYSIVASIDERFSKLSYLMKAWAKARDINSSRDHTMNSLSIISLVAFHLQTREPPILPPFSELLKDGIDASSVERNVARFNQYGKSNQECIAKLFLALLRKLSSAETLWRKGLCVSLFEGCWIYKIFNSKVAGRMNIEDFLNRFENFARSVSTAGIRKICEHVNISLNNISDFAANRIEASKLKELLFKPGEVKILNDKPARKRFPKRKRMRMKMEQDNDQFKRAKNPKFSKQTEILNQPVYQTPVALPILMLPPVQPQVHNGFYGPAPGFVPPPFRLYDHPQRPVPPFLSGYGNGHPPPFIREPSSSHRLPPHQLGFRDGRHYPENPPFMHPGFGRRW
ncbi:protein HESO1-like isoform X2 [Zingiber officinale]|nr:protein HESO1-like isoform X2 [Zingiber officinale]XP_042470213.1 protein HESO1-like isoform X2 [Zingiber officinale]XP_042470214.1 protein HESO1-like isoform X2 [Zingiber officinale]